MAKFTVGLGKMKTKEGEPVHYFLGKNHELELSNHIGDSIKISFEGNINCIVCDRPIKKTFGQGFCFPCFREAPEASECVLRPELCKGHLGEGRDVEWEEKNHVQPHIVYLAASSAVKVGITREVQVPFRWIDQGATSALPILRCTNRYEAGRIEVLLKELFTDKTSWQKMLKNDIDPELDLLAAKSKALAFIADEKGACEEVEADIYHIHYPVDEYPEKVKSLKLDKQPIVEGVLKGIKGQYLILDQNRVINIRSHSGYQATVEVDG